LTSGRKVKYPDLTPPVSKERLASMRNWTKNTQTQADVKMFILDSLWDLIPRPPFSEADTEVLANRVYDFVWD